MKPTPKCKKHGAMGIVYEEQPESSPHAFKARCKFCRKGFIKWVTFDELEQIIREQPDISIVPRLTSTYNELFKEE